MNREDPSHRDDRDRAACHRRELLGATAGSAAAAALPSIASPAAADASNATASGLLQSTDTQPVTLEGAIRTRPVSAGGRLVAGESESGTFELLLSKPVHRWEPLVGKYLGITIFGFLTMVAGLLVGGVTTYTFSGASPQAISGGIGALLPGVVVYALVLSVFMTAVGTLFAVLTGSRLKTALVTAVVPVLFFAFIFVRLLPVGDTYEGFFLYLVDVNYHLGNLFVLIQETVGPGFNSETAGSFSTVSGVYDVTEAWTDPVLGGIVGSVPLSGYVPPAVSSALVLVLSVVVLAAAVYQFQRMDIA